MQQQREALLKEKETSERIAARAFAQSYLADLVPSVFSTLNQNGFFYDPVERGVYICYYYFHKFNNSIFFIGTEVETVFMPFLMEETEKSLHKKLVARTLLDGKSWNFASCIQLTVFFLYWAAVVRNVIAQKLGIELVDPEPAAQQQEQTEEASTATTSTHDEQTTSQSDTQQPQKEDSAELKKVFGDIKEGEEQSGPTVAGETGDGEDGTTQESEEGKEGESGEEAPAKDTKEGESEEAGAEKDEAKEGEGSKDVTDGNGQITDSEKTNQETKESETELQQAEKSEAESGGEKADEGSKEEISKEGEESGSQPAAKSEATPTTETNAESAGEPPVSSDDQS